MFCLDSILLNCIKGTDGKSNRKDDMIDMKMFCCLSLIYRIRARDKELGICMSDPVISLIILDCGSNPQPVLMGTQEPLNSSKCPKGYTNYA